MGLTIRAIQAAVPGDTLWDDDVKGLHLRAFRDAKVFYLKFRTRQGQQRKPKVGTFPEVTLELARSRARAALAEVYEGRDPKVQRDAESRAWTLKKLGQKFIEYAKAHHKGADETQRMWDKYVASLPIASKMVSQIEIDDVAAVHSRYASTPYQANRILQMLSSMLSWAEVWSDDTGKKMRGIGTNPCQRVRRFPEPKRKRYMSRDELRDVMAAVLYFEQMNSRNAPGCAFIKLLIYTGARSSEIRIARWDWVRGNYIEYPSGTTKTEGATDAGGHRVFLSSAAKAVLDSLPRTSGTITGIKSANTLWCSIRERAGCPDLRLHDLRHSFASIAKSNGATLEQIGDLLNHSSTVTTARYAHLFTDVAEATVEKIGTAQSAITQAVKPDPAAAGVVARREKRIALRQLAAAKTRQSAGVRILSEMSDGSRTS